MTDAEEFAKAAASLTVVRGSINEDELAALVASWMVLNASASDDAPGSPTSAWMDRSRTLRGARVGVLGRGENAWRHSLR